MKRTSVIVAVGLVALSTAWAINAEEKEEQESTAEKMSLSEAPSVVQEAIKTAVGSATVTDIEKETEDGLTLYEAGWKVGDVEHQVSVNAEGEVMESEADVSGDAVPKAVQAAAKRLLPEGAKPEFEKKMVVLYEVAAMVAGKEVELLVDPSGRVMELEADDDDDEDDDDEDDDDDDE